MDIQLLEGDTINKTRALYEQIFADSKEYTDYFYHKITKDGVAIVMMDEEVLVAHLFLIPKLLSGCDEIMEAFYVYGVATKEEYRNRGIMKQLMEYATSYANTKKKELLYLIPVNEKLYEGVGFSLVREEMQIQWELTDKEAKEMLKFNLEKLNSEGFTQEIYQEIQQLEGEIDESSALMPFRDYAYYQDRIKRTEVDKGGFYFLRNRKDYSIEGMIITGEYEGETVILDVIGKKERKQSLIQDFMRWEGKFSLREMAFPIMIKGLRTEKFQPQEVLVNDEV